MFMTVLKKHYPKKLLHELHKIAYSKHIVSIIAYFEDAYVKRLKVLIEALNLTS